MRTSSVSGVHVNAMLFSAVLEVGDSVHLDPSSVALAVQRPLPTFSGQEGDWRQYRIFRFPGPVFPTASSAPVFRKQDECPDILVDFIHIHGISASGILHIGNTGSARLASRVLHIRQLPRERLHAVKSSRSQ